MPAASRSFDALVQTQLGLVTHTQLGAHGWTQEAIEHARRVGRLIPVHHCVYRWLGAPMPYLARLLGACLHAGPDAAVSHRAAAHVRYQHPVVVGGRRYRTDFAVPHVLLGIEVDGLVVHGTRQAAIRDRARRRDLRSVGWDLMEYTVAEITRRPATVAREIQAEVRRRERVFQALDAPRPPPFLEG